MNTHDYRGESPTIDIEKSKYIRNNDVTITISGDVNIFDESDAIELLDGLEESLIDWKETRSGLEKKIEGLEEQIEQMQERLDGYRERYGER